MGDPEISVLLPARDAEATVAMAVRSLLQQRTRAAFEVLCIDDGSSDGTRAQLLGLAAADARVRVLDGRGLGLVHALRLGLAHARARDFIARMDADDEALPLRLERSLQALREDRTLAGVGTGVELFRDDRPVSPNLLRYGAWLGSLTTPERLYADRYVESPLCHPSVLLRRGPLEAVGAWEEGDFAEDWQLWLKLLSAGERLRCVGEVLLRWRDADARLTRTDARYTPERHLALKADFLARERVGDRLTLWGAGPRGKGLWRALKARGHTVRRFLDVDPRKVGQRLEGTPVEPVAALGAPVPGEHLLATVGAQGARDEIRAHLTQRGWIEGAHFTCTA